MPSFTQDEANNILADDEWTILSADDVQQMMFVSGETVEPSPETTMLVEQLVQQQVMEMVRSWIDPSSLAKLMTLPVTRLHSAINTTWQP
jgi:Transcription initiation factor IID, 18kD subunit